MDKRSVFSVLLILGGIILMIISVNSPYYVFSGLGWVRYDYSDEVRLIGYSGFCSFVTGIFIKVTRGV